MEDRTIKFIRAIKGGIEFRPTIEETAVAFMSDYSGVPESRYTNDLLFKIVKDFFLDFLKTADNPSFEMWRFFDVKYKAFETRDDTYAMLVTMQLAQVRNDDGYVNGFRDLETVK